MPTITANVGSTRLHVLQFGGELELEPVGVDAPGAATA
jgi:hypothetical protein